MKEDVDSFVLKCLTCQQVKAEHQKSTGLLQSLLVAEMRTHHDGLCDKFAKLIEGA